MSRMGENAAAWIWLQEIVKGIRFKDKLALLDLYRDPSCILSAPKSELIRNGISSDILDAFFNETHFDEAKRVLDAHEQLGIHQVTRTEAAFRGGDWLVLFFKGRLSPGPAAAVVGTRGCTEQGRACTRMVCQDLAKHGVTVNSGLARGIDQQAHRTALDCGGRTQAFLAHGLDLCYPREHFGLLEEITENGAALSPFRSGIRPYRHHFALRNALLCAWSDEVIVTEAPCQSGSLMTADFARHLKKRVRTIEPDMSERSVCGGNRKLLDDGAESYRLSSGTPLSDPVPDDDLVRLLRAGSMQMDEIAERLNMPFGILESRLLQLSLTRWVFLAGDGKWHFNGW